MTLKADSSRGGVDSLADYNAKRRFQRTREPRGRRSAAGQYRFVVQQHDATRMHYDFRLELDGVLLSWAVPKGPSLSTKVKRLAVQTEDHPVSYRNFEGEIPQGEYGGGTVIVWDRGRWTPEDDPREGLRKGHLSFSLDGEKLHGRFSLVRTGGKQKQGPKSSWLLFKRSDEHAREGKQAEITAVQPDSVISGEPITRRSRGSAAAASPKGRSPQGKTARRGAFPALKALKVQLATLVDAAPHDQGWVYEVKLDGYRMLAGLDDGQVELRSRNGLDWSDRFPAIAAKLQGLKAGAAALDGELCHVDADGISRFQSLQNALPRGSGTPDAKAQRQLVYYVFDLLMLDGEDLRGEPLESRKQKLRQLVGKGGRGPLQYVDHAGADGGAALQQACAAGLEGLIAKRADAAYRAGRGPQWLKLKCRRRQEFVIVGSSAPQGSRSGFGALLLAVRDGSQWRYVGKVGSGFNDASLRRLQQLLKRREVDEAPVSNPPRLRGIQWVRPELVCEVAYTEMTTDGSLRHPSFQGLREDKPAADVHAERAAPLASIAKAAKTGKARKPARSVAPVEVTGITISHPERIVDAESGVTKADLARYLELVAEPFGRFALNRPLAIVRCPDGAAHECFFQKHRMAGTKAVQQKRVGDQPALYAKDARGLMELVQFNAIEFHGWGATMARPAKPDWVVFDLDPDPDLAFAKVADAAVEVREAMRSLGLESFLKTTGGKGLHVVVPIVPRAGWDEVKGFARAVAETLAANAPQRYVATMSKAKRAGKIFIDYLRNGEGATAVLPYSPRARPGMPVAWPVAWKDLRKLAPGEFAVRNAAQRLRRRRRDPWQELHELRQQLPQLDPDAAVPRRRRRKAE